MPVVHAYGFDTIGEIRRANRDSGHHWFEPSTLRFFGSRILPTIYYHRYFISSEQDKTIDGPAAPRLYTIRHAADNGSVSTVGNFQAYTSAKAAQRALKALVAPVPGTNLDTSPGSAMFAARVATLGK